MTRKGNVKCKQWKNKGEVAPVLLVPRQEDI